MDDILLLRLTILHHRLHSNHLSQLIHSNRLRNSPQIHQGLPRTVSPRFLRIPCRHPKAIIPVRIVDTIFLLWQGLLCPMYIILAAKWLWWEETCQCNINNIHWGDRCMVIITRDSSNNKTTDLSNAINACSPSTEIMT